MKKRSIALMAAAAMLMTGCGALSVGGDTVGESAAPAAEGAEGGESAAAGVGAPAQQKRPGTTRAPGRSFRGGSSGVRTLDLGIKSPLLYQLS